LALPRSSLQHRFAACPLMADRQDLLPLVELHADEVEIGHYGALLDTLNVGLLEFAVDGSLLQSNTRARALLGGRPAPWLDENGQPLSPDEHLEMQVVHTGQPVRQRAIGLRNEHAGTIDWYKASAYPVFGDSGTVRRILLILADLSRPSDLAREGGRLPTHDPLTGLFNQRYISTLLDDECRRAQRYGRPFVLALLAIDNYTGICQTDGQQAGENALAGVGRLLARSLREFDMVGRFATDEFLLILPNARVNEATSVLERLRESIETSRLRSDDKALTISGGLTEYSNEDTPALIDSVRSLLAAARAADGNRICVNLDLF